jgi:hypothetical protein
MSMPSHNLLMAAVNTLQLIEVRDGYQASRAASDLMDDLIDRELQALNDCSDRRSRNDMQHILRMLLRRDARLAGVDLPCLSA